MKAPYRRGLRDGLVIIGLAYTAWRVFVMAPLEGRFGADAFAYWTLDVAHPYALAVGLPEAFVYPPPAVRLFAPAALLSWPQFWFLWLAILVGTAVWLGGRRALMVFALPFVGLELVYANINLLLAAAIALGFRYPAAWAFVLLTKVTPGIGLLWFAVRREWGHLAVALGVTAAIVALSLVVDGRLWAEWLPTLQRDMAADVGWPVPIPLWLRLPIAAVLVVWGARSDRPWTVPVGATLALPVIWLAALSMLAALFAINRLALRPTTAKPQAAAQP